MLTARNKRRGGKKYENGSLPVFGAGNVAYPPSVVDGRTAVSAGRRACSHRSCFGGGVVVVLSCVVRFLKFKKKKKKVELILFYTVCFKNALPTTS